MTGASVPPCDLRQATYNLMSPLCHREDVEEETSHTDPCCGVGLDRGYLGSFLKAVLPEEVLKLLIVKYGIIYFGEI